MALDQVKMAGVDFKGMGGSDEIPLSSVYGTAEGALKSVGEWHHRWGALLYDASLQLSYGIVGANWAIFESRTELLGNWGARISLGLVITFLGLNLLFTWLIQGSLRKQYFYAEGNPQKWLQEFESSKGKSCPWPSTEKIDKLATALRFIRTWIPLVAGIALIVGSL